MAGVCNKITVILKADGSVSVGSDCGWVDKVDFTSSTTLPTIGCSPASLTFTAIRGGANPSSQTLNIQNTGSGILNWSVTHDAAWLSLNPAGGSSAWEINTVTASVYTYGLNAGTYTAITGTGGVDSSFQGRTKVLGGLATRFPQTTLEWNAAKLKFNTCPRRTRSSGAATATAGK
jgi:hypothetical protein